MRGRLLVRTVAMHFDRYLREAQQKRAVLAGDLTASSSYCVGAVALRRRASAPCRASAGCAGRPPARPRRSRCPQPRAIHCRDFGMCRESAARSCSPSALATGTSPSPGKLVPRTWMFRGRRGDGVAAHALGQRHEAPAVAAREAVAPLPVLVGEIAVAKVGDAGAADLPEARERCGVGADAEQQVDPVAAAFHRRAMMRCPEKHERAQMPQPRMAARRRHSGMRCAPRGRPCCARRSRSPRSASAIAAPAPPARPPIARRWSRGGDRCCSAGRPACTRDRARAPHRGRGPADSTGGR